MLTIPPLRTMLVSVLTRLERSKPPWRGSAAGRARAVAQLVEPVGQKPSDVAADADGVWITDNVDGTLTELDPVTGESAGEPIEVGPQPRAVSLGLGYVWVAIGGDGTVLRIDPGTREVVGAPIPVGGDTPDVSVGADTVWAADFDGSTVSELRVER
jgi:streptogramin lyase